MLALGAAAATIVVVLAVLSGPSIVNCFNSTDGMGQCLQGKMRDAGLLPANTAPMPVEATIAPAETAAPAATDAAAIEPELDVTPPADVAATDESNGLIAATFGLLRAEPDGSVVIAGSGTPGSEVEVYSNGALLGKAKVETSGDWVLVPDAPIAPGGTEITLGETGKQGLAAQSFVVAINDDKTSEPLVVASTPGAASEVLQGLPPTPMIVADAAPAETTSAASSQPEVTATPKDKPAAATTPADTAPATPSPQATPATQPAPAAEPAPSAQTAPAEPAPAVTADTAPAAEPATPAEPAPAASDAQPAAPAATATPSQQPAETATAPEMAVATAEPAPAAPAAVNEQLAPAMVEAPTIDAVEVDGERSFFAGSGANGATIRLYVDDAFIADTKVADGRWLIEAGKVLTKPSQRVRVDMLNEGSADVIARAEVDFVIDVPATAEAIVTAQADPAAPAATATDSADETAAPVRKLTAVNIGGLDEQRFAAGKAIIRRGDNLWTIARRAYGQGIKYTTIYEANTIQIRNPDRIYPGQVFDLPDDIGN